MTKLKLSKDYLEINIILKCNIQLAKSRLETF